MKKSILDNVHPDYNFWVVDGTTLKNMHELLFSLENMDEATFKHHVNEQKNDFHNWVRDVHKDEKLANMLSQVIDRESTATAIKRRIQEIHKPDRELGKGPLQNKERENTVKENKRNKGSIQKENNDKEKRGENAWRSRLQNLYNYLENAVHSWKTDRILAFFQASADNEAPNFLKAGKVPFPKPVVSHNLNHRKYEIIVTVIAVVFIISLIGISSQAAQITGAVIGSPEVQEVQFLGLGGVFAVVVLLFAALHAIEKHSKDKI